MLKHKGFTLIELMITVAIIGILASIAYPSYVEYVAKGVRADGLSLLVEAANRQEQFYLDNHAYTANMTKLGFNKSPFVTDSGDYSLSSIIGAGSFTLTATALAGQAKRDSGCATITINETGAKSPKACW